MNLSVSYNVIDKPIGFFSSITQNVQIIFLALFSFVFAWHLSGGLKMDFSIPLIYAGDGLSYSQLIKRLVDGAWYFNNSASGFPFGSNFLDYPGSDAGNFFVLKLLALITGSYAKTLNLYYLLSFPVTAVVSFYVLRKFSISNTFSLAGAIIFTFLPFHFIRLVHLFYTWYFSAPLFAWFCLRIFTNIPPFFLEKKRVKSNTIEVILLLILSSFCVYYAFFGILMLILSGSVASIRFQSRKNILSALIAIFIVSAGVGANLAPNIIYRFEHGVNHEVGQRLPFESETYGLKISQLLLPLREKGLPERFSFLQANNVNSFGTLGSIGFLMLIALALIQRNKDPRLYLLSSLLIFLLLFATIDGFSALFAIFITPSMRGWDRISIFIGFISITGLMVVIDQYFKQKKTCFARALTFAAAIGLVIFALWDQTIPSWSNAYLPTQQAFTSDRAFVQKIESIMPAGAAIYQLPYMPFPETSPLHELTDYDLFRGYLHSTHLNWSSGGMKGRPGDLFFRELFKQPIARQLEIIKRIGFDGIYIDRRGYEDRAAALEAELSKITGQPPAIVSADSNLVFFALSSSDHPSIKLPAGISANEIMQRAGFH